MCNKITSLIEFVGKLGKLAYFSRTEDSSDETKFLLCFRGHNSYEYNLIPSLFKDKNNIEVEDKIFEEMILEQPEAFVRDKTTFEKLVRMQHHGLPTRLLDITENPLVALYFACSNYPDDEPSTENDGEVIVFKIPKKHIRYSYDFKVSMLSNICRLKYWHKDFNNPKNCQTLLHKAQLEMPWYNSDIDTNIFKWVVPVKPQKSNDRIKNQYGLFFLFAGITPSEYPCIRSEWILTEKADTEIIIAKESKGKIRKQLDSICISHRTLFPPNLDETAELIKKRIYKENNI